jgi:hypothetical protein
MIALMVIVIVIVVVVVVLLVTVAVETVVGVMGLCHFPRLRAGITFPGT